MAAAARAARVAAVLAAAAAAEGAGGIAAPPVDASAAEVGGEEACPERLSTDIFSTYVCHTVTRGIEHPGSICEAASLCAIRLPATTFPLFDSLPPRLIEEGLLSKLQLEGILYACTKHQEFLPDNQTRAGFFIGDGAGVGKGRQVSGIILDSFARGRKQHLWISTSTDLVKDAERDLHDLGVHLNVIHGPQALDSATKAAGLSREFKEAVLFCTYASLTSNPKKGSRLEQIVAWCGGGDAFDGVLILDECHRAKNFTPGKEAASTKLATAVVALQQALPRARVVYCSATGVSEIGNMAYMSRMGFWGAGTAFPGAEDFMSSMKQRGLGFLEMLAMEMKAEGKYVSRSLSFADAEFTSLECTLDAAAVLVYDQAAALWARLRRELTLALGRTRAGSRDVWKTFWATMQRFFKLLCVSMKLPTVLAEVQAALAAGQCAVIGLQSTGEAAAASLELNPGSPTPFVSVTREMLSRFICEHFPTRIQPDGGAGAGVIAAAAMEVDGEAEEEEEAEVAPVASAGAAAAAPAAKAKAVTAKQKRDAAAEKASALAALPECRACAAAKAALLADVAALALPNNPVDELIDRLGGPAAVAECTGRKGRVVRNAAGRTYFEQRASPLSAEMDSLNIQEKDAFMKGTKLVAIISDAASTGISLHADARVGNQLRRVHFTVELPWSADKAIQQLGRTHRSNQVVGPLYKLVVTPLGGEKRFAAAVARRLQSLGALTRGDRRAASGLDLSESNLDSPAGRKALRRLCDALADGAGGLPAGVALADVLSPEEAEEIATPLALHARLAPCAVALGLVAAAPEEGDGEGAAAEPLAAAKDLGDVRRFLNRLLGMSVAAQNLLFRYFSATLAAELRAAKAEGKHSEGVSDLPASNIQQAGPKELLCAATGGGTLPTMITHLQLDRGVSFDAALQLLAASGRPPPVPPSAADAADEAADGAADGAVVVAPPAPRPSSCPDGFYRSRRELYGKDMYVLAIRRPGQRHLFGVTRPNTGASFFEFDREELRSKYIHVADPEHAREGWTALFDATKEHCMHGAGCERGAACSVGRRMARVSILGGAVVPIWGALESVLRRHEHTLARSDRAMRAVRVELDDGATTLVGIRFPEQHLEEVKLRVTMDTAAAAVAAAAAGGGASGSAAAGGGSARLVEAPAAVDAKALAKALQKPRTIHDFFTKKPSAADGAGAGAAAAAALAAVKRPAAAAAAAAPAGGGKKQKVSPPAPGGAGARFVGPFAYAAASVAAKAAAQPQPCPICGAALSGGAAERDAHVDACLSASGVVVIDD